MKSNILGNIVAEYDEDMLNLAFYETPDYKSLLESNDRCVIVGRRGTGKSALVHKLNLSWRQQKDKFVVSLAPEEDQIIGLRGLFDFFGDNFIHIKAAAKISWKYALYMEISSHISSHYKLRKSIDNSSLGKYIKEWGVQNKNFSLKLRNRLKNVINNKLSPEENIADLSDKLNLDEIELELQNVLKKTQKEIILLIDRLDEGYTPDNLGVSLSDGCVQAIIDVNNNSNKK